MTGPEKKVQEAVCKYAKGLGYLIKRSYFGPGVEAGWPDTEIYMPYGYTLHIEFKAPGKPASKLQKKRIRDLRERGHMAIVCDNIEQGKAAVDMAARGQIVLLEETFPLDDAA